LAGTPAGASFINRLTDGVYSDSMAIRMTIKYARFTFALTLFFALSGGMVSAQEGDLYLLQSHDPVFLQETDGLFETFYSNSRTVVVRLKKPLNELPSEVRAKIRPVKAGEIYNAPAKSAVREQPRPDVTKLLSKVSGEQIRHYTETLAITGKRSVGQLDIATGSGNKTAVSKTADILQSLGYTVEKQCYKKRKFDQECNVIGRKAGASPSSDAILTVAHMDSVGYNNAGADDNASGTAGLLEMARVLAEYKTDAELVFLAANGEETDIAGSTAYAAKLKEMGLAGRIKWAINMDMIAWNKDGVVELETNQEFKDYAEFAGLMAKTYTNLTPHIAMPAWGSDHVPFLEAGIPTYLSIEHWENHNPCYHKACDTMDKIAVDYAVNIVKLNLAVIAHKTPLRP